MSKRHSDSTEQGQGRQSKEPKVDTPVTDEDDNVSAADTSGPVAAAFWTTLQEELLRCNPELTKERLASRNRVEFHEDVDGVSLRNLDLSGLGLVALPPTLEGACKIMTQIRGDLRLQGNRLESLPDWFDSVQVEGDLSFRFNLLTSLSPGFCEGIRVGRNLHLGGNRLSSVPESFANIHVGMSLIMTGNPFPKVQVGQRVKISGLQSRPELNGQYGKSLEALLDKGRWRVRLDNNGQELSLKEQCLNAGTFPFLFPNVGGIVFSPHAPLFGPGHYLGRQGPGSNILVQPSPASVFGLAASLSRDS